LPAKVHTLILPGNKYIFFLNLIVIQLKLLKNLAQISLPAYGDYVLASPMAISEEQKTNARKLSLVSCELKYSA
jgi:hypothetical protein